MKTAPALLPRADVHPLVKIAFTAVVCLAAYTTPNPWTLALILLGLFGILWRAGMLLFVLRILLVTMSFFAVFLYLFQGFFSGGDSTVLLRIGPLAYREDGAVNATDILLRLMIFVTALLFVFTSNRPRVLVDSLLAAGLPPPLGFVILATLQLAPRTQDTLRRIADAQRMRGLVHERSFADRVRGLIPLLGPLVLSHLRQVEEQSLALEERGFQRAGKTLRFAAPFRTPDRWALILATLTVALLIFHLLMEFA